MKLETIQLDNVNDIYKTILLFNEDFIPSLTDRGIILRDYAQKLQTHGIVYALKSEHMIHAFIAFYANDQIGKCAYLAQLAVKPYGLNKGYGYTMIKLAMNRSKQNGMQRIKLEVFNENKHAIDFYIRQGFDFQGDPSGTFCHMIKEI